MIFKRIDFGLDLIKSPSGRNSRMSGGDPVNKESVYVALPLAVPDFRFQHELPGGVAEPIRDQYDGSCTAFYAVRHFSDVSNERFGVTVSPVESSLVEYGYPRACPLVGNHEGKFERDDAVSRQQPAVSLPAGQYVQCEYPAGTNPVRCISPGRCAVMPATGGKAKPLSLAGRYIIR